MPYLPNDPPLWANIILTILFITMFFPLPNLPEPPKFKYRDLNKEEMK